MLIFKTEWIIYSLCFLFRNFDNCVYFKLNWSYGEIYMSIFTYNDINGIQNRSQYSVYYFANITIVLNLKSFKGIIKLIVLLKG